MKAKVDQDACTGCGLCEDLCPQVFEMADDVAKVTVDQVPDDARDCAKEAEEQCPVDAITVE